MHKCYSPFFLEKWLGRNPKRSIFTKWLPRDDGYSVRAPPWNHGKPLNLETEIQGPLQLLRNKCAPWIPWELELRATFDHSKLQTQRRGYAMGSVYLKTILDIFFWEFRLTIAMWSVHSDRQQPCLNCRCHPGAAQARSSDQAVLPFGCFASLFTPQPSWLHVGPIGSRNTWQKVSFSCFGLLLQVSLALASSDPLHLHLIFVVYAVVILNPQLSKSVSGLKVVICL